jgi:hypothetical protein
VLIVKFFNPTGYRKSNSDENEYKMEIKWKNVFLFIYIHAAAIYGFTLQKQTSSVVIGWICGVLAAWGTTGLKTNNKKFS